jgi:acyl carrier protein
MHLQEKLADYMIPSAFVKLDKIPLNANGKFDRGALPDPDDKRPPLSTLYALPRNEMEKSLVQIWEEVLGIRPIGIQDKFFDLGGHSLSATRVVSRVIKHFGLDISLQSLFRSPTVADMAAEIIAHQGKRLDQSRLAAILDELESLLEAEAERLVSENNSPITKQ